MKLNIQFVETSTTFGAIFEEVQTVTVNVGGEVYDGTYSITPKTSEQTLHTTGKVMLDDVTVNAIPYFDVSNVYGGRTVYIANEV